MWTYSQIREKYAGNAAVYVADQLAQYNAWLNDALYHPVNDNFSMKTQFSTGVTTDVGVGLVGEAKAELGNADTVLQERKLIEVVKPCVIPATIYDSAPDKEQLIMQELAAVAGAIGVIGTTAMLNGVTGNSGLADSYHDDVTDDYVINAGGGDATTQVTDCWVIRWDINAAMLGFLATGPAGIQVGEATRQFVFDTAGLAQEAVITNVKWVFTPVTKVPNAVVRITNLTASKPLTTKLLLKALALLAPGSGRITALMHPSQYQLLVEDLSAKANYFQTFETLTQYGELVPSYAGAILRPTVACAEHAKLT